MNEGRVSWASGMLLIGVSMCGTGRAEGPAPSSHAVSSSQPASTSQPTGRIACRGCEHSGRFVEDNPGWGPHLVTLFCAGKNPDSPWQTAQQHLDWAANPIHSYVADGAGALVVWAHPSDRNYADIIALRGLAGIEVSHGGDAGSRERLWDRVLTQRIGHDLPPAWGFAADDTHSITNIDKSWFAVRLAQLDEKDLKRVLGEGGFYVSNGPAIGDIQVEGARMTVKATVPADIRWVKAGQYGTGEAIVDGEPGQNHCLKIDKAAASSSYTLNDADGTTDPAQALFVRCIVTTAERGKAAFTQPFVIRAGKSVANPYAAAGEWYKGQTHNHCDAREGNEARAADYYAAYAAKDHACAFETGYDYWVMPYLYYPPDRTPVIEQVEPGRVPGGYKGMASISGRAFAPKAAVLVDGKEVRVISRTGQTSLVFKVPPGLAAGRHDVTVRNPDSLQDTRQYALAVQSPDALTAGWTTFTPHNSTLGSRYTYCVAADPKGGVWIGTNYGLNHFDGGDWKVFRRGGSSEAILANTIYDLAVDADGTCWYTCFSGIGTLGRDGAGKQWPSAKVGIARNQVNQVLRAGGATYVTPHNVRGLFCYKDDTWRQVAGGEAKSDNDRLIGLAADKQGRLWLGTGGGLVCRDPAKDEDAWKKYTAKDSPLPDDRVMRLAFDSKGRLWMGTATPLDEPAGGLCCLDGDKWTVFTVANSPLPERRIWAVFVDRDDNVWAGTGRGVLCRRADGSWRVYNVVNSGLADDLVTDIAQDREGNLWFTTANGVSRLAAVSKPPSGATSTPSPGTQPY